MIDREINLAEGGWGASSAVRGALRIAGRVAALLVLAYIISVLVVRMDSYFVFLAAVIVIGAVILSRKFELGILIYFFIAPFNTGHSPAVLGTEASYDAGVMPSQIGLIFLCAVWVASRALGSGISFVKTRLNAPLMAFLGVAVLSIAVSYFIWDPDVTRYDKQLLYQVSEVGIWVLCAVAFLLTANSIRNRAWLPVLYWPVVLVGLYVTFDQFTEVEMPWRISHNVFMIAFAATLTTARLFFKKEGAAAKIGLGILLAIFLAAAFYNRIWVSGWLATAIGVMVVILFYSRRLFVAVAIIALFALFVYPGFFHSVYSESREDGDLDRLDMWVDAARMAINTNPVLGIGPGDYMAYGRKYGSNWYGVNTYTTPHSSYPQMIAELGLLGIAAFLWLLAAGVGVGVDSIRRTARGFRWFAVGATAVFASIATTSLVGDYILPSRVNGGIWTFSTSVFPWLLLGAAVAAARYDASEEPGGGEP